jgi:hypothetical protein
MDCRAKSGAFFGPQRLYTLDSAKGHGPGSAIGARSISLALLRNESFKINNLGIG